MPDSATNEPNEAIVVADASADTAALEAHIDEELGLPKVETTDVLAGSNDDDVSGDDAGNNKDEDADGAGGSDTDASVDATGAEDDGADVKTKVDDAPADDQVAVEPSEPFITVTDANGKEFKITKIEDLPEDFAPKNNRQVIEVVNSLIKLENEIARNTELAEQKATADAETARQQAQIKAWDSEIDQLQKEGRIDKPKVKQGSDKFTDDPAVKRVDAVFKVIQEINQQRATAGNPNRLASFEDALTILEAREAKAAAVEAEKAETKLAKDKAGLIGGSSSSGVSEQPVYRAGQARDIYEV